MLFLVFRLGEERCALDAAAIVEVLPLIEIRRMLRAPAGIAGTINYRGALVPVIDLAMLILGRPSVRRLSTRIVIADCARLGGAARIVGLIAEHATEILRRDPADFVSTGVVDAQARFLGPIAVGEHGTIQRIELDELVPAPLHVTLLERAAEG